jgi:hypothetical protein
MDIQLETTRIREFVARGNYHAALNIALSCMNDGYRNNNQAQVDEFLGIIRDIYESLARKFGSKDYLKEKPQ